MYETVPPEEIERRCHKLQETIHKKGLWGVLLNHPMDLYYFTGSLFNGLAYLPAKGDPLLLVKKSRRRTEEESPLTAILLKSLKALPELLEDLFKTPSPSIGMTLDVLQASTFVHLQRLFPKLSIEDVSLPVREVRMIKSNYELKLLKRAGAIVEKAFKGLRERIKVGVEERELSIYLENRLRREGHHGFIRTRSPYLELHYGQVVSGENGGYSSFFDGPVAGRGVHSAIPHGSGHKRIEAQEPILMDYCGQYGGYIVDETRVFVLGDLPASLKEANQLAVELLEMVESEASLGSSTKDLYEQVLDRVKERGLEDHFMGYRKERSRFIGHGVGLELDEFPVITGVMDFTLQEGMVFALEPKFVFPEEGAVGIESTYYMGREGLIPLTSTPKDPSFFRM